MMNLEKRINQLGIIVVDMQNGFKKDFKYKSDEDELIGANKKLIIFGIQKKLPIFFLKYVKEGKIIKPLRDISKNYPLKNVIKKYHDNGFIIREDLEGNLVHRFDEKAKIEYDSALDLNLRKFNLNKLIFSGVNKGVCVLHTAQEALNRGYKIFSSRDLMNGSKGYEPWYRYNCSKYFKKVDDLIEYFE